MTITLILCGALALPVGFAAGYLHSWWQLGRRPEIDWTAGKAEMNRVVMMLIVPLTLWIGVPVALFVLLKDSKGPEQNCGTFIETATGSPTQGCIRERTED